MFCSQKITNSWLDRKSATLEAEVQSKMEQKERGTQELAAARKYIYKFSILTRKPASNV